MKSKRKPAGKDTRTRRPARALVKLDLLQPVRKVPAAKERAPVGYAALLEDLKARIRTAQIKAVLSVNRELIQLYWDIGKAIVQRQQAEAGARPWWNGSAMTCKRSFPVLRAFRQETSGE